MEFKDYASWIPALQSEKLMWPKLRKITAIIASIAAVLAAMVYAGDYAVFRFRVATNRNPYGSVTVDRVYAVPQKNGKTEFLFDPPAPQTCVHALFPHQGYSPCWYLSKHTEQRTDM
jgi:hypothetical protein